MTERTLRKRSATVFLFIVACCLAQAAYFYPQLPGRIASHFGPSGHPDAWSAKASFFTFYLIVVGLLSVFFLAIGYSTARIPPSLINLPNWKYWLGNERKAQTFDYLSSSFLWFASATMLLFLDVMHQTFLVQVGWAHKLNHPALSLGLYIGFTILWTIGFFIKFLKKTPEICH